MFHKDPETLILTIRMDDSSQQLFDVLRTRYFPPERNLLKAHLTLFHKLPNNDKTIQHLSDLGVSAFEMEVSKLINLGAGVAYFVESDELRLIHSTLSRLFSDVLSAQDKQGFRPHITVQNKATPEQAKSLLTELSHGFRPFTIHARGFDLWNYLGGPWQHKQYFPFK